MRNFPLLFYLVISTLLFYPTAIFATQVSVGQLGQFSASNDTNGIPGNALASVGDINGDGYDDILIGATAGSVNGTAYLIYGRADGIGSINLSKAVKFVGEGSGDLFGATVAGAGDVNGDGYDDFLIGAYRAHNDQGKVYLFYGQAQPYTAREADQANVVFSFTTQYNYNDQLGAAISGAGDVNGDGYDDVIMGAPQHGNYHGSAFLVYGRASFSQQSLIEEYHESDQTISYLTGVLRFDGVNDNDHAGHAVAGGKDIDGDGKSDLIVGAPSDEGGTAGISYVILSKDILPSTPVQQTLVAAAHFQLNGENSGDNAGYSVALLDDMDGDNTAEIAIGAPFYINNGSAGAVYVLYGSRFNGGSATIALNTADTRYLGEGDFDRAGWIVQPAGDVNHDSYSDLLIGAPYYGTNDRGAVYLVYGSATPANGTITLSGSGMTRWLGGPSANIGSALAPVYHSNNDVFDDIVMRSGYSVSNSASGSVYLMSGQASTFPSATLPTGTTAIIAAEPDSSKIGSSVTEVGDVDGDGQMDVVIGASGDFGAVYLVLSGSGSANLDRAIKFTGEAPGDRAGFSVAALGDISSDGYADFAIGAPYQDSNGLTDNGALYIIFGGPTITSRNLADASIRKITGQSTTDHFGWSVTSLSDLTSDGAPELVIGAPGYTSNAGSVYVFTSTNVMENNSPLSAANADTIFTGVTADIAGSSVAAFSDISGDAKPELLIGAPSNTLHPGSSYLLYSQTVGSAILNMTSDTLANANVQFSGENNNDQAGFALADAGDVNGDTLPDLMIGAPGVDSGRGSAYLLYGVSHWSGTISLSTANVRFTGETVGNQAGYAVGGAQDIDDDGYQDILVGAPTTGNFGTSNDIFPVAAYIVFGGNLNHAVSQSTAISLGDNTILGLTGDGWEQVGFSMSVRNDYAQQHRPAIMIGTPCQSVIDICSGSVYIGYIYTDRDEDNYNGNWIYGLPTTASTDCDDDVDTTYPGAPEFCDGTDNNCNGDIDEGLPQFDAYPDYDTDSYGDITAEPTTSCVASGYYVADHSDCDDWTSTTYPGAPELCNEIDDNCNSEIDELLACIEPDPQPAPEPIPSPTPVPAPTPVPTPTSTSQNHAPVFSGEITNVTIAPTDSVSPLNLAAYFSDPDGDPLHYAVTGNTAVDVIINPNGTVQFVVPDNATGAETITFTAYDPSNASAESNSFTITIIFSTTPTTPSPTPTPLSIDKIVSTNQRDCLAPDYSSSATDKTVAYVKGTKAKKKYHGLGKKPGIVRMYNAQHQLIRCVTTFPQGGVKARLHKKQQYVFSIKYRSGTTLHVNKTDISEQIISRRVSPQLHRRKLKVGELDGKKKTIEVVTSVRRGRMIYIKIYSFNTVKQMVRLVKRKSVKNIYGKRYHLVLKDSVVKVQSHKDHTFLTWQPWTK